MSLPDRRYVSLREEIQNVVSLTHDEMDKVCDCFTIEQFSKREAMLSQGQIARKLYFIMDGLVRVFYLREGKEVTTYLACDKGFVSSYSSFLNQNPSIEGIQCLEDTLTLSIEYSKMQLLYHHIPAWQMVGRVLAEKNYLCMAERVLKLQMVPAKEKYMDFLQSAAPKIVKRTPMVHIASFLGITPESLSRIRKNIS